LEPICPCIVYSHPYALKSKNKDIFISKISNINESQYIETLFKKDIAFIAMEFMNDYKTLNSLKKSPKYEIYKYMAIYELNNLHKLGYMHNDFHFDNVLIHETYNYFDFSGSGRAIIIDFGLSDLVPDNINQIELLEKELGQINKDVLQIFASLDEKHIAVQTQYISAIENQSKKKIHDLIKPITIKMAHFMCLIKLLSVTNLEEKMARCVILILQRFKLFVLYKGGMKIKRIGITPKKHEWSLIPIEELKDLMVTQFLENLKIQNPKSYNEFTNGIESVLEIEKKYPDYLESLFKGQSTGLIQIDNKK
jgi:tRNA A-37 threonylcarbamoyl transferase component Bud32